MTLRRQFQTLQVWYCPCSSHILPKSVLKALSHLMIDPAIEWLYLFPTDSKAFSRKSFLFFEDFFSFWISFIIFGGIFSGNLLFQKVMFGTTSLVTKNIIKKYTAIIKNMVFMNLRCAYSAT